MRCLFYRSMAVALMLASGVTASAQSLADVARLEEERRKAVGTAGKVYTNEQLRPDPSASGMPARSSGATAPAKPAESPTAASGTPAAGTSAGEPAKPGGDVAVSAPTPEETWRKRVAAEREAVSRSQVLAEALQSRINALTTDFENRDDPAQRSVIAANRQKALAELDRVKKEIEQHQKAVAAIQEEARRAGVPAGWTR